MAKRKWQNTPLAQFDPVQALIKTKPQDDYLNQLFSLLGQSVLGYLDTQERFDLVSKVVGKEYFAFGTKAKHSRSVNKACFADGDTVANFLEAAKKNDFSGLTSTNITQAAYTLAVGFACVVDLLNPGDKQTPGCLYQYLVTHLLTREFKNQPSERVKVAIGEDSVSLTMDLVIDPGNGQSKYHVAIKNSTRERASEFWAQQHILDEAFPGHYRGFFFGMAETKLDHRNFEVVEICVPEQWRAYQHYLAKIQSVYYLDPPNLYLSLKGKVGGVDVKPFGEFFGEVASWSR